MQDAGLRIEQQLRLSEQTFEFACNASVRFAKGDAKVKKEMLAAFGSNLLLKDKKLLIEATDPLFILEKSMSDEILENETIEPKKNGSPYMQKEASPSLCPSGLGDLDDVRTSLKKAQRAAALIYNHYKNEFGLLKKMMRDIIKSLRQYYRFRELSEGG